MRRPPDKSRCNGFTLLEALIASAILSMAIIGITVPFASGAATEADDARRTLANSLAQELMEEILTKAYDDTTTPKGVGHEPAETSRSMYDSVNDYDNWNEYEGQIKDLSGRVIDDPAAEALSRHAHVSYVRVGGQAGADPICFARVQVEIRYHNKTLLTLTRLVYQVPTGT